MNTIKYFSYLFLWIASLHISCANQKILYPNPKIGFDINQIDKEGLIGEGSGKTALHYEFCIPAENPYIAKVKEIDPSLQIHKKSRGRIACTRAEWLCIGSSHQENAKQKLQRLAELPFIKRIEQTVFE